MHQPFTAILTKYPEKHSFIISLLRTHSLNKHIIDIASTGTLLSSDIICLTETQLVPHQNTVNIENALSNFSVIFNSSERKFRSLAFCHVQSVEILNCINIDAFGPQRAITEDKFHMYDMFINKPTHLSGSLLDQVRMLKSFAMEFSIVSDDYNVYFSDHDAVKVHFQGTSFYMEY